MREEGIEVGRIGREGRRKRGKEEVMWEGLRCYKWLLTM